MRETGAIMYALLQPDNLTFILTIHTKLP